MNTEHFHAIVVGTGQGGKPLARAFADAGRRTAILERGPVGGSCVNVGCTPTKALVGNAAAIQHARRGDDFGFTVDELRVDMKAVRERKRRIVEGGRTRNEKGLRKVDGLELILGDARFDGPRELIVDLNDGGERRLKGDIIVLNNGLRPNIARIPGLDDIAWLDSTSIQELDEVPEHLVVIGGSFVGLEFAQMFRRFGSQVTVVEVRPSLMPEQDEDISEALGEIFTDDGIEVFVDTKPARFERESGGRIRLHLKDREGQRSILASHVLMATGLRPNTDSLNADAGGVLLNDNNTVKVDSMMRTSAEGVYAMGDVKGGPAFTHISYDDYRILEANLIRGESRTITDRAVPSTMFTDPQLAHIGLREKDARAQGLEVHVPTMPAKQIAYAMELWEDRGMIKAVVEKHSGRILGFTALCYQGGELMSLVQTAMRGGLTAHDLRDMTYSHPSLAEALNNLFGDI